MLSVLSAAEFRLTLEASQRGTVSRLTYVRVVPYMVRYAVKRHTMKRFPGTPSYITRQTGRVPPRAPQGACTRVSEAACPRAVYWVEGVSPHYSISQNNS